MPIPQILPQGVLVPSPGASPRVDAAQTGSVGLEDEKEKSTTAETTQRLPVDRSPRTARSFSDGDDQRETPPRRPRMPYEKKRKPPPTPSPHATPSPKAKDGRKADQQKAADTPTTPTEALTTPTETLTTPTETTTNQQPATMKGPINKPASETTDQRIREFKLQEAVKAVGGSIVFIDEEDKYHQRRVRGNDNKEYQTTWDEEHTTCALSLRKWYNFATKVSVCSRCGRRAKKGKLDGSVLRAWSCKH